MTKRIGGHMVDVASPGCGPELQCFWLGFDKGRFVQGRGYTHYHKTERPVCFTRHQHGCPMAALCRDCNFVANPAAAAAGVCGHCKSSNLEPYSGLDSDFVP